jgi:hypothetical protein
MPETPGKLYAEGLLRSFNPVGAVSWWTQKRLEIGREAELGTMGRRSERAGLLGAEYRALETRLGQVRDYTLAQTLQKAQSAPTGPIREYWTFNDRSITEASTLAGMTAHAVTPSGRPGRAVIAGEGLRAEILEQSLRQRGFETLRAPVSQAQVAAAKWGADVVVGVKAGLSPQAGGDLPQTRQWTDDSVWKRPPPFPRGKGTGVAGLPSGIDTEMKEGENLRVDRGAWPVASQFLLAYPATLSEGR